MDTELADAIEQMRNEQVRAFPTDLQSMCAYKTALINAAAAVLASTDKTYWHLRNVAVEFLVKEFQEQK